MLLVPVKFEIAQQQRLQQHAIKDFATGVGDMADRAHNTELAELVERLTAAMQQQAEATARHTTKPKMHPLLVAVVGTMVTLIIGGLVTYGALQSRVTTLEARTQSIDRLNSIDAKLESLIGRVTSMETRFNESMDSQARGKR